jgi:hypothetical protein
MEYAIGAFEGNLKDVVLHDVTAYVEDFDSGVFEGALQVFQAATDEVIVNNDLLYVFLEEVINGVGSDQTGTANKDEFASFKLHDLSLFSVVVTNVAGVGKSGCNG